MKLTTLLESTQAIELYDLSEEEFKDLYDSTKEISKGNWKVLRSGINDAISVFSIPFFSYFETMIPRVMEKCKKKYTSLRSGNVNDIQINGVGVSKSGIYVYLFGSVGSAADISDTYKMTKNGIVEVRRVPDDIRYWSNADHAEYIMNLLTNDAKIETYFDGWNGAIK